MTSVIVQSDFPCFDASVRDSVRTLLDGADTASPFQDPLFCGTAAFGEGVGSLAIALVDTGTASFYGRGTINYASSRMLQPLRMLDFHKGPVSDDLASMLRGITAIEQEATRRGFVYVDISPQWTDASIAELSEALATRGWRHTESEIGTETLRLNVDQNLDTILAHFRQETRHKVRRAQRSELRLLRASTDEAVERFYVIYSEMCESKAIAPGPLGLFSEIALRLRLNSDAGVFLVSYLGDEICGGSVVLRAGRRAHYVFGAADRGKRYRSSPVGYALQWAGIQWAKNTGCSEYDFGGFSSTTPGGVPQFKRGFGGQPIRIAPRFRLVLRPTLYRIGSTLRGALHQLKRSTRPKRDEQ